MNSFYSYIMLVAALAIFCALLEGVMPEGKLKATVLFAIGLLFLIGILSPLFELLHSSQIVSGEIFGEDSINNQQQLDKPSYIDLLEEYYNSIT